MRGARLDPQVRPATVPPRWPKVLLPIVWRAPSVLRSRLWLPPAEAWATPVVTVIGLLLAEELLVPSWPAEFDPMPRSSPSDFK